MKKQNKPHLFDRVRVYSSTKTSVSVTDEKGARTVETLKVSDPKGSRVTKTFTDSNHPGVRTTYSYKENEGDRK